jgi:glycerol kinase
VACIVALDQGTTSSRAIIFDDEQRILGSAQRTFEQFFPQPGWVEHDPEEIWQSQRDVAIEAIADAGLREADISAIGITNQRETTIVWDRRTGKPLHNAIVWQDRRTAEFCASLRIAGHEPEVQARTGLVLDPYFSASKIRWILDHCDGARDLALAGHLAFGTVDSWLVWKLTNATTHITDMSNASRTSLLNLHTQTWDDEMLALWDIPRSMLPNVVASSGDLARSTTTGLNNIPITGIAGDQQAALFGQACFEPGQAKCTYGTGCFVLLHSGEQPIISKNRLLTTVAWTINGTTEFALEGSVFIGGALIQWLRDSLGLIEQSSDIETLAGQVDSSDGVVFVPAFAGLGPPHWDPDARGALLGLTRGTTKAHIALAALEGIAFQVADVFTAMKDDVNRPIASIKVDGGASENRLLMQIQASLLQTKLIRAERHESTALGAASLAGLAIGVWKDRDELAALWRSGESFTPAHNDTTLERRIALWREAVKRIKSTLSADTIQ